MKAFLILFLGFGTLNFSFAQTDNNYDDYQDVQQDEAPSYQGTDYDDGYDRPRGDYEGPQTYSETYEEPRGYDDAPQTREFPDEYTDEYTDEPVDQRNYETSPQDSYDDYQDTEGYDDY